MDALILTLRLDPAASAVLDALRRAHFPPERNVLDAHLTLFHALPGDDRGAIEEDLEGLCAEVAPFPVRLPKVRSLGRGVAVEVESEELSRLRRGLASRWGGWLTPQDRQGFRPHVTIQNKVEPRAARELLARLAPGWEPREATALGLDLWRYAGGPWDDRSGHDFRG